MTRAERLRADGWLLWAKRDVSPRLGIISCSREWVAAILQGPEELVQTNAPQDLKVVGVRLVEGYVMELLVWSSHFKRIPLEEQVPNLAVKYEVCVAKGEV